MRLGRVGAVDRGEVGSICNVRMVKIMKML